MAEAVVVDASAMVDLLVGSDLSTAVSDRLRGHDLHAPAHFDAEVLSALGRLHRSGHLTANQAGSRIERLAEAPVSRHNLAPLLMGAWGLRHKLRLVDAFYVVLSETLDVLLVTTDRGLAAAYSEAQLVNTEH